jgi:hypothetical protein
VGEIILHALVVVHHDRGTNGQRRDSEHRADHPLRASELGIESELLAVGVGNPLKGTEDKLDLQRNRSRGRLTLGCGEKTLERRGLADHLGDLCKGGGGAVWTRRGMAIILAVPLELCGSWKIWRSWPIRESLGTREADEVAKFLGRLKELVEIDRPSERNVSKVTGAQLVCLLARGADLAILYHSEPCVKDPVGDRLIALIGLVGRDLDDGPLADVLGVGNAELDADDCIPHSVYLLLSCVDSSVFSLSRFQ